MAPPIIPEKKYDRDQNVDPYNPAPPPPSPDYWWNNFAGRFSGPSHGQDNLAEFDSFFIFSRKTFDYICGLVEDEMVVNHSDLKGEALSLKDQVTIALMRLTSGLSLDSIGDYVGVNQSAVGDITWSFVEAMEKKGSRLLHWPSTEEELTRIKSKFEGIKGLPNCCGAIDSTDITLSLSSGDPSSQTRLKEDTMVLQAVVDPDMRFLDVYIGSPGCSSDKEVLYDSDFYRLSEERLKGKKHIKVNSVLEMEEELREYIVGDTKFPLLPWLITPYQGRGVFPILKEDFNKRHYQTWKVANEALKRLKDIWKIIEGVVWRPEHDMLARIANVCCMLHNILVDQKDAAMQDEISLPSHYCIEYIQRKEELPDQSASIQREKLALYLVSNRRSVPGA